MKIKTLRRIPRVVRRAMPRTKKRGLIINRGARGIDRALERAYMRMVREEMERWKQSRDQHPERLTTAIWDKTAKVCMDVALNNALDKMGITNVEKRARIKALAMKKRTRALQLESISRTNMGADKMYSDVGRALEKELEEGKVKDFEVQLSYGRARASECITQLWHKKIIGMLPEEAKRGLLQEGQGENEAMKKLNKKVEDSLQKSYLGY